MLYGVRSVVTWVGHLFPLCSSLYRGQHSASLDIQSGTREVNKVTADTEAGTGPGSTTELGCVSIEDDESACTHQGNERDLVNTDLLLRDRVCSNGNNNTFNQVLDEASDQRADVEVAS